MVLQQSLRDAETAYRNFFASLKGERRGAKIGAPRFKSRKDSRQSIRFTANARWSITGSGKLNLPKIGAVKVIRRYEDRLAAVPAPRGEEMAPNPCACGNGPARPAAPSTTGTTTPRSISKRPPDWR